MKDIEVACSVAHMTAGLAGIPETNYETAQRLLNEYGAQREQIFREMVELLGKYDVSGIASDWKDRCNKGKDLLNRLDDNITDDHLRGYGLDSFRRGELKIWDENARAEIALSAFTMQTIHLANLTLIQDCNEELQRVLSDKKDVQKLVEGSFGATKDVLVKTVVFLAAIAQIQRYTGQPRIPDQIKLLGDQLTLSFSTVKEATAKKQALLKILIARIELLKQLKSKLNEEAIVDACETGTKIASALQGLGKDFPYDAADWEEFGKDCKEKLEGNRDRIKETSKTLFNGLYGQLDDQMKESFAALSDDPAQLKKWNDEIGNSFNSIQEALDNQAKYADCLVDGPIRQGLNSGLATAKALIKLYIDDWNSTIENAKNALRRN